MGWGLQYVNFFTMNSNLKYFFFFWGWVVEETGVSDFILLWIQIEKNFFWGGWGDGGLE